MRVGDWLDAMRSAFRSGPTFRRRFRKKHNPSIATEVLEDRTLLAAVFGDETIISSNAAGAESVFAVDLDGDGDMDVLTASRNDDKIAWYENNGNQTFTSHTISTDADGAKSVFAADMDGDLSLIHISEPTRPY